MPDAGMPSDRGGVGGPTANFSATLKYRFTDPSLLARALCHPSQAPGPLDSNQRLEFLGDRVLGLAVSEILYAQFPNENEGALARRLASLVRRDALARVAANLGLGDYLNLGRSESESGGQQNPANLADALEAVIAAIYLDGGLEAAVQFIRAHWVSMVAEDREPPRDAKTALQEWSQARGGPLPEYVVVSEDGPPHAPVFEVEVRLPDVRACRAEGASKRVAEQAAAGQMLEILPR